MKRCIVTLVMGVLLGLSVQAATFSLNLTNGQSKTWSDSTVWTLSGVPGISDTVTITNQVPWAGGWMLVFDAGWAASVLNISSINQQMNQHTLNVNAGGTVGTMNVNLKNSGAWQLAVESHIRFPYGDNTGYIGTPPPKGTIFAGY